MHKVLLILLSIGLLVGCNESSIERNIELEGKLNSLNLMVSGESDSEISMNAFINFEWDKAFLIAPYTSQEEIEKKIGVTFKDQSAIHLRDDIYLLVFLHNEKVVQYAEVNRQHSNFSTGEAEYLTPSNDLLLVTR